MCPICWSLGDVGDFFFDRAGLFAVDARATLQKAQASSGVSYNELCLGGKLLKRRTTRRYRVESVSWILRVLGRTLGTLRCQRVAELYGSDNEPRCHTFCSIGILSPKVSPLGAAIVTGEGGGNVVR